MKYRIVAFDYFTKRFWPVEVEPGSQEDLEDITGGYTATFKYIGKDLPELGSVVIAHSETDKSYELGVFKIALNDAGELGLLDGEGKFVELINVIVELVSTLMIYWLRIKSIFSSKAKNKLRTIKQIKNYGK